MEQKAKQGPASVQKHVGSPALTSRQRMPARLTRMALSAMALFCFAPGCECSQGSRSFLHAALMLVALSE